MFYFDSETIGGVGGLCFEVNFFEEKVLKCTKIDFGWSSAPDPAGGAYSAPQTLQLDLSLPTSKGKKRGGRKGEEREGEGPHLAFVWGPVTWLEDLLTCK